MISIFKDSYNSNLLKEHHLGECYSYIVDNNLNYYLKILKSDLNTLEGREKLYSIIPISYNEIKAIREGILSINHTLTAIMPEILVSLEMTVLYNFTNFNTQVSIESIEHN